MRHRLYSAHPRASHWRHIAPEAILAVVFSLMMLVPPAGAAALRLQERTLYINDTAPNASTFYKVSFKYMSSLPVGSVDMLFCIDPIPYHECVAPEGLDVSSAVLSSQTGERGFSILSKTKNSIVLTRDPASTPIDRESSYTFDDIQNPSDTDKSFSIRLRTFASYNATGPQIDFGSIKGQVTDGIEIQTQVPPMLIFCLAEEVEDNCTGTNDTYYREMGQMDTGKTLLAESLMAVGTNATGGFAITVQGTPMSAGIYTIDSPLEPTESRPGSNQFGINLVENTTPAVGKHAEGEWANAQAAEGYNQPNKFKYVPGDVVAYSPNVSLMKKFTVSYMLNASPSLRPGVYSTTLTYIASGRF